MESVIKESTSLYYEIDDCITELLKARLDKDTDKEHEAICKMESLMINTMQYLSWLVGELKGHSLIKWQTGEPQGKVGRYLVKTKDNGIQISFWSNFVQSWSGYSKYEIIAWCKLSDIKHYKEEKK